ncbi:HAD family hydrolase [Cellvibrio sp.]|uniref:HAD family hydrolase n=1 Tax=Cellvibrio sp. TaxID=1965322 RepID=UPI00396476E1
MNSKDKISHVAFDLFGTLIKFGVQHHPFRQLLKWARENGRQVLPDDARTVMTINGSVDAISYGLGINPPRELVQKIESQIEDELSSLSLFDDVIPTLNALQFRGIRIGLCSNLAQPYGAVIGRLLADFDLEQFLSYELGAIKPEAQIYASILDRFNCEPKQCLFIGDTFEADYAGPTAVGMKALHLTRSGVAQPHQISSLGDVLAYLDGDNR